jgi:hypothetical protein
MTIYAGETVVFKTSALNTDDAKTIITDLDVTSVLISIVDVADDSALVTDGSMTWDATDEEWRYIWTTPVTAGSYLAKMRLIGPAFDVWEFQKLKTKTNPDGF